MYDGKDPEKFEPWLSKLESACLVGKRDVREVAICSSTGPVLEVLNSIEDKEDWATHRDKLRCCFSTNKTRVHVADLLSNFRRQHANENLRSFIHQYTKMHCQATGLKPDNDYDLSRKVEFMKRIRNTQIANKIIRSNRFKDYTRYSLQACFARALELEGDFQVGEVVTPNYVQAQVLAVEGEGALVWPREMPVVTHSLWITKGQPQQGCTIQMFVGDVGKWDTLQGIALLKTPSRPKLWVGCITRWKWKHL